MEHGILNGKPVMLSLEETEHFCGSFFLFSHVNRKSEDAAAVFYGMALPRHWIRSPLAHRYLIVSLELLCPSVKHILPMFYGSKLLELCKDFLELVVSAD